MFERVDHDLTGADPRNGVPRRGHNGPLLSVPSAANVVHGITALLASLLGA